MNITREEPRPWIQENPNEDCSGGGVVALACALLAPAVVQAAPATLKGKLSGVKLPAAGAGVASVRAMNVNTSAVVAARQVLPMPMFETVTGTRSSCADPEGEGDAFGWAIAAGIPALVNAPLPGGPVAGDWGMAGSGAGNTGGGSPDQTWAWTLVPSS